MRILTKYLLIKYIKNFIIVLLSLQIFFVGIDFLQNFKDIPNSANLQVLYLLYNAFFTLTLTLPLSLAFAWILTLVIIIKTNELVAALSLGATLKDIYTPIVKVSFLILFILISLQATPLAYSYEQKSKIADGEYFSSSKEDIFLKYNEFFVYFKKLYPLKKIAEDIHIYKVVNNDITESIIAKKAYFQNNRWYVVDAKILKKPQNIDWDNSKLEITNEKFLYTLEGFKPKILDSVYESKSNFSIIDAVSALILLNSQDINTNKIRASLYYEFVPFFILPLLVLFFSYTSFNSRFFNTGKFVSLSVTLTLVVWGIFFLLHKLSSGGLANPELFNLFPLLLFFIIIYFSVKKKTGYS